MSASVRLNGFDDLVRQLTAAPEQIRQQGMAIVKEETEGAATEIRLRYPTKSGALVRGVRTEFPSSTVLVGMVKSGARHSHLYEFGTATRQANSGANRGQMPKPEPPIFVPIVMRRRQRMYQRLAEMLRQMGFQVQA
jgi:hypothetical protein